MRTKLITINEKEYWLTFSAQSQIYVEQLRREGRFDLQNRSVETAFALLSEELRAGYHWAKLNGQQPLNQPPKNEDLADMMDPAGVMALMPTVAEIMNGERNVIAKAPKKAEAGA